MTWLPAPADPRQAAAPRHRRSGARAPLALAPWLAALVLWPAWSAAQSVAFSVEESERIVALGPWPPVVSLDPSNRVSGQADAIELGRRLFADARLSPVGYIGCVTCHQPDRAWTDLKARAHGLGDLDRNTQPLNNLRLQRWYGWAGTSDTLWMASIRPMLDAREMDSNPAHVRRIFTRAPEYACLYRRAFGSDPLAGGETDEGVMVRTAKALAAFVETLSTGRTRFDALRDTLARGMQPSGGDYPAAALRGLRVFVGKGRCVACHSGPNLSDGQFHDTAVPPFPGQRGTDPGRQAGLQTLGASRFTLSGRYNDDARLRTAALARAIEPEARHRGAFRTPSLRNVASTPPYMHNGSLDTLRDAVRHHARLDPGQSRGHAARLPLNLELDEGDADDLVAFLQTLGDERGGDRGLPPLRTTACDTPMSAARRQ